MKNHTKLIAIGFLIGTMVFGQTAFSAVQANYYGVEDAFAEPVMPDMGANDPAQNFGANDPMPDMGANDPAQNMGISLDELCNNLADDIDNLDQRLLDLDNDRINLLNETVNRHSEMGNIISFAKTANEKQEECYGKMTQTYLCSGVGMSGDYAADYQTNNALAEMKKSKSDLDQYVRIPLEQMLNRIINTENDLTAVDNELEAACQDQNHSAILTAEAKIGMAKMSVSTLEMELNHLTGTFVDRSSRFDFGYTAFKDRINSFLNEVTIVMNAHAPNTVPMIINECRDRPNTPWNLPSWAVGEKTRRDAVITCIGELQAPVANLL
jgi:hypothetical protein